ncbi:Synaptotagmin-9 [Aphelenchoides besseyi]|nr:Synaptotagmin-9 [Aphelenchoides besseyi]KAI6210886.1 Synaptotagmin-9 [Aphelenchoides besseyi]
MLSLDVAEENQPMVLMYALSGTVLVMIILFLIFLAHQRRNRLNWYEQNLLECQRSPPQYMRCKALPRLDTDEDCDYDFPTTSTSEPAIRKQSRIRRVRRELPAGDVTGLFQVPKLTKHTSSMFHHLDQSQIDRGMYPTSMEAVESNYDEGTGFCGSLKLGLYMDTNLNLLTVSLKQAIDLVAKRQDGYPNSYYKVALDVTDQIEPKHQHQTKICFNNSSPLINEDFCFQVSPQNLQSTRLEVMVYDYDKFSIDECIGYIWLSLKRVAISTQKDQPTIFWAEVLPFEEDAGRGYGEILFSTSYLSKAQRLTVNVFKARNLPIENTDMLSSSSIRVSILTNSEKRLKRKKTSSKKNTKHPMYNEALTFTIPKSSLCDTILEIEAIHDYGTFGMASRVLGRMELPLHRCRDLWRAIIREEKPQARWYPLEAPHD